ncbi:N-acetylmuramoyl-L-alanine amidase family protein [Paenibacillus larvae]|uniref:N-acetylmuramoyl-L-alanine amidase family protein n=1 Tax=Paenibacillus larvae TaxID=1464 RepID=UPI00202AEE85|nr:N-acetylmuramoyl-L-alanine amidase [Paenibacillus larvae]
MKVVIDPGHGGRDSGAVGVSGLKEKDVTLDIGLKVRQALRAKGIEGAMTRETDTYVSLQDRVSFTNRQLADLFVSIHANSTVGGPMEMPKEPKSFIMMRPFLNLIIRQVRKWKL